MHIHLVRWTLSSWTLAQERLLSCGPQLVQNYARQSECRHSMKRGPVGLDDGERM